MFSGPIRGGTRGGQGDFKWSDVADDKDRENYLGHSILAPVGRWQKNRDITWYNKDQKNSNLSESEQRELARKEELKKIKALEEDALSVALGFQPAPRDPTLASDIPGTSSNSVPLGPNRRHESTTNQDDDDDNNDKETKKLEKAARKAARAAKREKKAQESKHRSSAHDDDHRDYRVRDIKSYSRDRGRELDQDHYRIDTRHQHRSKVRSGEPRRSSPTRSPSRRRLSPDGTHFDRYPTHHSTSDRDRRPRREPETGRSRREGETRKESPEADERRHRIRRSPSPDRHQYSARRRSRSPYRARH